MKIGMKIGVKVSYFYSSNIHRKKPNRPIQKRETAFFVILHVLCNDDNGFPFPQFFKKSPGYLHHNSSVIRDQSVNYPFASWVLGTPPSCADTGVFFGWSDPPPPPYSCLQFFFACWFAQDPAAIWIRSWNSCTNPPPPLLNVRPPPPF